MFFHIVDCLFTLWTAFSHRGMLFHIEDCFSHIVGTHALTSRTCITLTTSLKLNV
jgi:hypothetical protein